MLMMEEEEARMLSMMTGGAESLHIVNKLRKKSLENRGKYIIGFSVVFILSVSIGTCEDLVGSSHKGNPLRPLSLSNVLFMVVKL